MMLPPAFLGGMRIAISVSESADLARLGLTPLHCDLAVAELARAIYVAGGTVVYGGRLVEAGYTQILLDELRSYRDDRDALVLCVPESEWRRLSTQELRRRRDELHVSARLICVDAEGREADLDQIVEGSPVADPVVGLSKMRAFTTEFCEARVVLGGRLEGFQGALPGVVEEATLSLAAAQPLYVAGGFGGAAAAVASELERGPGELLHPGALLGIEGAVECLMGLRETAGTRPPPLDGLDGKERAQLAVSYRPGDIASIVLTGLGRVRGVQA